MRSSGWIHPFRLTALCLLIFPAGLICDEDNPPITWGEIPREQLEMKTYPPDTNATAVVLCDFGEVKFDQNDELIYTRHCRIKILSAAGFEWGTHEITYKDEDGMQSVDDIEGTTTTLGPDGSVVESELESESIFDEALVDGWKKIKFTLPMLAPGCVIEYRYTVISKSPFYMPDWYFQNEEPTLWSEFRVTCSMWFSYSRVTSSLLPFTINDSKSIRTVQPIEGGAQVGEVEYIRYAMKDVPALREEPYMTSMDDFRSRVSLQLSAIIRPGRAPVKVLNTWTKVAEDFAGLKIFGQQMEGTDAIGERVRALTSGLSDPQKKGEAIYDFVRTTMVWDGRKRIFCSRDLDEVLESKKGTSADINILLISMFRQAGIKAYPVLVSTRDHGKIQQMYPIIEQFNYLIVCAEVGDRQYLCDATDRFHPFGFLPDRALNHLGFLIQGETYDWIRVESTTATTSTTNVALDLMPDGSVRGNIQKSFDGHFAVVERDDYADEKPEDYMKTLLKSESFGMTLDSFHISNANDVRQPFMAEAAITSSLCTQVTGEYIYVSPFLMDRSASNPFKSEQRIFPVDYAYPRTVGYTLQMTIPKGFTVKEMPRDVSVYLPNQGGAYTRTSTVADSAITMRAVFSVSQTVFDPVLYASLRSAYDRIVALEAEQIVIQKIKPPKQDGKK